MAKIKEVLSSEVHWLIGEWNTRDQANTRIRQLLGDDAKMFAPVQVTHGGYFWSAEDPHSYNMLSMATEAERQAVLQRIDSLRQSTIARFPNQKARVEQVFSWPNDDFVFWRPAAGAPEVVIAGWGFANYKRAQGGTIKDTPDESKIHDVSLSFAIDGIRRPLRAFEMLQGVSWKTFNTDHEGIYALGRLASGEVVHVRDTETGREFTETVGDDTEMLELDVTEYVDLYVNATRDGAGISGEDADLAYGHRNDRLALAGGRASRRLPWLEGEECIVSLRGQQQRRQLAKDTDNIFNFDFTTARMNLTVRVSGDGNPISNEPVDIVFGDIRRRGITGTDGTYRCSFDSPSDGGSMAVSVRDRSAEVPFRNGDEHVDFVFDTPEADIFDATVRTVDLDGKLVPFYPVTIDKGENPESVLTDWQGCTRVTGVESGAQLKVSDTNDPAVSTVFDLDSNNEIYDFVLPYRGDSDGDCTLRVIERTGSPSEGTTVILSQDDTRIMAHLDAKGEMHFGSDDFTVGKPVKVSMYSTRRPFPELSFTTEKDEKEYELREVDGPTPWWKIAGEIILALGLVYGLLVTFFLWRGFFESIPILFA